ncbi:UNVERIFIED_CONTAM: hypothetical protein GTU68_059204 [Idotea baltica]|nr:hypothetical protein [Idotea baltica]
MNNLAHVTQREVQVLQLVAHEYTTKEIASTLYISNHTVISHRKNLMEKLGVKNVAGLVRRAFETHLLQLESQL